MPLQLPDGWNVPIPDDEDVEQAFAAHHGAIVARQLATFTAEALPWDPGCDHTTFTPVPGCDGCLIEVDCA